MISKKGLAGENGFTDGAPLGMAVKKAISNRFWPLGRSEKSELLWI
jgi:hypothetical protein